VRFNNAAIELGPDIAGRVALAVANDGSTSMKRYVQLCGDLRTAKPSPQKNIFVQDVAGMVRFENTMLEFAIKQDMESSQK